VQGKKGNSLSIFHRDNLAVKTTNISMTKAKVFHPYRILSTTIGFPLPVSFSDSNQEKQLYFLRIHEGNKPLQVFKHVF